MLGHRNVLNKHFLNKIENKVPRLKQKATYTCMEDEIVIICLILSSAYTFSFHDSLMHMLTKYVLNFTQGGRCQID